MVYAAMVGMPESPPSQLWRGAALTALLYCSAAAVYFAGADRVLGSRDDPLRFHVAVEWAFVGLSTAAVFVLVWRSNLRLWRRSRSAARSIEAERREQDRMLTEIQRQMVLLEDSERRYRTLSEASRDFIFIVDREGEVEFVNAVAAAAMGTTPEGLIGQPLEQLFPAESLRPMQASLQRVLDGEGPLIIEESLEVGGRTMWLNTSLVPIDESGSTRAVLGVSRDISERRESDLAQSAVHKISQAAISVRSLHELYEAIHAVVAELMPAENLYIALCDGVGHEITFDYWVDEKDPRPEPRAGGRGLTEYVIRTGRPLLTSPQVFAQLRDTGEVDTLGSLSLDWLGVPLRFQDRVIGVLAVQTYAEHLRYADRDKQMLEFVSTQIALAIEWTRAKEALGESEERYRRLVELSPDGIAIHAGGRLEFVNRQGVRMLGMESAEAALGLDVLDFVHPGDREMVGKRIRRGIELGEPQPPMEERFMRADGSTLHVEVSAIPFVYRGKAAILVVFRDISERLKIAEQLRQAQKMEAVGQLAGGVAHDFNNLLQAVLAAIQVLRSEVESQPKCARVLSELEANIGRGASLTRQLLLFSRRDVTRREKLDLEAVVDGAAEMLERLVPERVRMRLELCDELLAVEADWGQLEQIVVNLVLNACDAMPDGGDIVLRTGEQHDSVWLEVEDTGPGLSEKLRARIFEPFFTTKPAARGSGLGLSVVHGIVLAHGGKIEVFSEVGGGSRFRVVLPRIAREVVEEPAGSSPTQLRRGNGERILLVEDEPATREGLAEVLGLLGYAVTAVESAEEAMALPTEPVFQVLLSDLALPGVDGAELGRTLRARWTDLEVIIMSGYAADQKVRQRVGEGTLRYLQKPFTMETLTQQLEAALDRR
jgi:PAS domain S-box-containing protein